MGSAAKFHLAILLPSERPSFEMPGELPGSSKLRRQRSSPI